MEHTPGPLRAEEQKGSYLGKGTEGWVVVGDAGWTAFVSLEADAILYAAAPALLAALETLLHDAKSNDTGLHWRMTTDPETVPSVRNAQASIALAKKGA